MVVVVYGPDLATGLVSDPAVDTSVLGDPRLGKNCRIEGRHYSDVPLTARGLLRQDDIADLEAAVGLVTSPGIRDVGEVTLSALVPQRPGPGRPGEVAGSEGLAPFVVSREVVAACDESRAVGIGGRIDEPAVPIGPIVEGPAIGLRVADIRNVGIVPGA